MSLVEIEQKVSELPEAERREFVQWVYENEHRLSGPPDEVEVPITAELRAELTRRREDLRRGSVALYSPEEMSLRVKEALNEFRSKGH
jgi:hypothetical protein